MMKNLDLKTWGAALILGGTALGAGMLALPVVTAQAGFLPSLLIYCICWAFSACTGLLFVEICLWMPQDANIISMASHLLGRCGKIFAWVLYLFLFYSLSVAYVAGGGGFVAQILDLPAWLGSLLFVLVFGGIVISGTRSVDRINWLLMAGLILSFLMFVLVGFSKVKPGLAMRFNLWPAFLALPVIFTSFSYQGTVSSIVSYLNRDGAKVRKAILYGTAIPFLAYVIWEYLILGIIPLSGKYGLLMAKQEHLKAVDPLKHILIDSPIYAIGQFFSFFALTTSFLGVTLGLMDFMSDGLQIAKKGLRKYLLAAIVFLPPLLITFINPNLFYKALGYAGGIGCALLLGFLPVLMTWVGRYKLDYPSINRQLPGGRGLLLILMGFIVFELVMEIISELS